MQLICKVESQGAMTETQWTRPSDGQVVTIKRVAVELKSGADTILCEANDRLAENLSKSPLLQDRIYIADLRFVVANGRQEGSRFQNCRLNEISYFI